MKPLVEAQREVLAAISPLSARPVPLEEALGLVLAEDVIAPHHVPPFVNSAMDGFAVRFDDIRQIPAELDVIEDVAAGHVATVSVETGTAVKIMTGAPLPTGADTVVKVEDTQSDGTKVRILAPTEQGSAVRAAGGDVAEGALVFAAGTRLTPVHLGVLATLGVAVPKVHGRPRVAIISTGDEVMPPDTEVLAPGRIRDANRPLLRGLLAETGVDVVDLGIISDDAELLRSTLLEASTRCDAILTSGGVSMGEYDLVKQVLTELGDIDLWRVAMQPAKPFAFGAIRSTPLFGLPGNPVSVLVAFEQFARPALETMMGRSRVFRSQRVGVLAEPVETDPEKTVFLRVITGDETPPSVRLAGGQSSNVLSAAATADAFAVIPVGTGGLVAGSEVTIESFRLPPTRTAEEVIGHG